MGRTLGFLLLIAAGGALAAPFGSVPDRSNPGAGAAPVSPATANRPLGAQPSRDAATERCDNLRRDLRQIADRQREVRTTGESNYYGLRYQQVLDQSSRAGC
jgi:hypothetical protein